MSVGKAWIEVELIGQELGELQAAESTIDLSSLERYTRSIRRRSR